ncbi:hypothetical protein [Curtobacterium herbarum]|uniref:PH domain-containing protein n=1 Tax=Curtobacterium herbarum TaxID=150122 RepID=A0ABP4K8E1_9MICO|nr:hypothetical protein [Curtobacterium herbarum]MBM7474870.1 hypothetical protein [Curtobacterium herbarum]MCS6545518.1 hypothetical protein [Curtobacterium herbarum]
MGATTARATPLDTSTADVVIRPRAALVRSTALSIGFSAVPIAVAVVWVAVPNGPWLVVGGVVGLFTAAVLAVFLRLRSSFVALDPDRVTIRGILSARRSFFRSQVHEIVLAVTHGAAVDRTSRELVAVDAAGDPLFRMRGEVWGDDGIDRLVDVLDVRTTRLPRPMSSREFARRWPGIRAWYERPRAYVLVGGVTVLLVAGLLIAEALGLGRR